MGIATQRPKAIPARTRMPLTLLDCFFYILRHDQELAARTTPLPPADPCESAG